MSESDTGSGWNAPDGNGRSRESVKDMAAGAVATVKQETATFAEAARDKARETVEARKDVATQTLGDFANAIRKAGDELANADQTMAGRVVAHAADGLEGFVRSVSDKKPEEMIVALREFSRRNPTTVIAGSVLVGVALSRFFKSTTGTTSGQTAAEGFSAGSADVLGFGAEGATTDAPSPSAPAGETAAQPFDPGSVRPGLEA
jgi:hypothetical protein